MSSASRTKKNPYAALECALDREDRPAVVAALAKLTDHEKDLLESCPAKACLAPEREECLGQNGVVHFARRLKRLLGGIR